MVWMRSQRGRTALGRSVGREEAMATGYHCLLQEYVSLGSAPVGSWVNGLVPWEASPDVVGSASSLTAARH